MIESPFPEYIGFSVKTEETLGNYSLSREEEKIINPRAVKKRRIEFTLGRAACNEALKVGEPYLLEPIMKVEAIVPEAFMGEVIGDLNARNGKIEALAPQLGIQVIKATAPLSRMFGYSTALRSATQGRGTFTMQFSHFDSR